MSLSLRMKHSEHAFLLSIKHAFSIFKLQIMHNGEHSQQAALCKNGETEKFYSPSQSAARAALKNHTEPR